MGASLTAEGKPDAATEELIERARRLAPILQERALRAEEERRLPDQTIADAEVFLSLLVPRRFGGQGLDLRALCEVTRELAHGDPGAAWTIAFMVQHNWMVCRLATIEGQEELFAERPFIRASAPLNPTGTAERVDGGYRVSGTFPYASGVWNADWTLLNAMVEEDGRPVPHVMLLPIEDVTINDDWFMSGMASTGSSSFSADEVFVPERFVISFERFLSADQHRGAGHDEPYMRYPLLAAVDHTSSSVALGSAEVCVEMVRERLPASKALGVARQERPLSRVRWGEALETVRAARLLWSHSISRAIEISEREEPWTEAEIGQAGLDCMTVVQMSQETISQLCDGLGSSIYRLSDPLQRFRRDIDVIANHRAHDRDTVAEAATRAILGLGATAADPFGGRAPVGALT